MKLTEPGGTRRLRRAVKTTAKIGAAGLAVTGVGIGAAAGALLWKYFQPRMILADKVVLITGGSRGFGFAIAQECAKAGARVGICARSEAELEAAQQELRALGAEVLTTVCDVTNNEDVQRFISTALSHFGQIDVLINNAGMITVGPIESQTLTDYQEAMDVMFWGMVYATLAVLPHMMARHQGWICNIASFGGKVAVPHLVPYCAAKFAAVGFSEGLHAEVKNYGISVTTVCPGLMRTGSHVNAWFKGNNRAEYTWFTLGAAIPVFASIDARRAARKVVAAIRRSQAELIITPQAKLVTMAHGVFPGITQEVLAKLNRFLPESPGPEGRARHRGRDSENAITRSLITKLVRDASREFHQDRGVPAA